MRQSFQGLRSDLVFSREFVFGESHVPNDKVGMQALAALKVKYMPVISVFRPDTNDLSRHEGVWEDRDAHQH